LTTDGDAVGAVTFMVLDGVWLGLRAAGHFPILGFDWRF
jgi:hypothetical protein